jgi:hypothetical protein
MSTFVLTDPLELPPMLTAPGADAAMPPVAFVAASAAPLTRVWTDAVELPPIATAPAPDATVRSFGSAMVTMPCKTAPTAIKTPIATHQPSDLSSAVTAAMLPLVAAAANATAAAIARHISASLVRGQ